MNSQCGESHIHSAILLWEDLLPFLILLPWASDLKGEQMSPLLLCQEVELTACFPEKETFPQTHQCGRAASGPGALCLEFYPGGLTRSLL